MKSSTVKDKRFELVDKWQAATVVPLALLGLLYLAVYSIQVVFSEDKGLVAILEAVSLGIWFAFAVDLIVRLAGARSLPQFLRSSWLELLALSIPFLRILRIFRVVLAIRGLRPFLKSRIEATGAYLLLLLPLTWFAGAVAVLDAEATHPNSRIGNLGDALWWSLATITTIGDAELFPISVEGKFVAATLMLTGIALFSAGAGMFASWIMGEKKQA